MSGAISNKDGNLEQKLKNTIEARFKVVKCDNPDIKKIE